MWYEFWQPSQLARRDLADNTITDERAAKEISPEEVDSTYQTRLFQCRVSDLHAGDSHAPISQDDETGRCLAWFSSNAQVYQHPDLNVWKPLWCSMFHVDVYVHLSLNHQTIVANLTVEIDELGMFFQLYLQADNQPYWH